MTALRPPEADHSKDLPEQRTPPSPARPPLRAPREALPHRRPTLFRLQWFRSNLSPKPRPGRQPPVFVHLVRPRRWHHRGLAPCPATPTGLHIPTAAMDRGVSEPPPVARLHDAPTCTVYPSQLAHSGGSRNGRLRAVQQEHLDSLRPTPPTPCRVSRRRRQPNLGQGVVFACLQPICVLGCPPPRPVPPHPTRRPTIRIHPVLHHAVPHRLVGVVQVPRGASARNPRDASPLPVPLPRPYGASASDGNW